MITDPTPFKLAPVIHRCVWSEVAKLDLRLINSVVIDELTKAATDAGLGTAACDAVADIFAVLSSINIRAKLLGRLRRVSELLSLFGIEELTLPCRPWPRELVLR